MNITSLATREKRSFDKSLEIKLDQTGFTRIQNTEQPPAWPSDKLLPASIDTHALLTAYA